MDIFTQKKLLVRIVIILTALNLFSIGIFLWKDIFRKPPRVELFQTRSNDYRDVSAVLEKELRLTEKQSGQLRKLRSGFFDKEKSLVATIRAERDSMNTAMFSKVTDTALVKSLARSIAENEYEMEILRFEQAQGFKSLCTPEQLEKFEELVLEIRDYFKPDNKPERK